MAFDAGSIVAKLQADISGFQAGMGQAQKEASDFGDKFEKGAHIAAGALAAVGVGLTAIAVKSTDFAVNYLKDAKAMSRVTGESVTETSRLMYVFKRMGIEAEETSKLFTIFAKKIVAARDNAEDADDSFKKLGITIKDAQGNTKGFEQILFEVADKFKQMPDSIDKTNLATQIFGRSGAEMIKVLNLGSDGIKNLMEQADKLGITLTTDNIAKVSAYIESQKKLKDSTDALQMAVGTTTVGPLADFNNKLAEITTKLLQTDSPFKGLITNVVAFGGPIAGGAAGLIEFGANLSSLSPKLLTAGGAVVAFTAVIAALVASYVMLQNEAKKTQEQGKTSLDAANVDQQTRLNAQKSMLDQGLIDQQTYNNNVEQINTDHQNRVNTAQQMANATWYSTLWNGLMAQTTLFGDQIAGWGQKFGDWQDRTRQGMENFISNTNGQTGRWLGSIAGAIGSWASRVWSGFVGFLSGLPGQVGGIFGSVVNTIFSFGGRLWQAAFDMGRRIWDGIKQALGIHSPSIIDRMFMNTADIAQQTLADVGNSISGMKTLGAPELSTAGSNTGNTNNRVDTKIFGNIVIGSQVEADDFIAKLSRNQEIADRGLTV